MSRDHYLANIPTVRDNIAAKLVHGAHSNRITFVQFIEQGYPLPEISVVLFLMLDAAEMTSSSRVYPNYSYL